ncbi:serine hydrolase domain-containing protein [Microbulbifer sp. ZKSA006]|uniref:serine hydrolase domain-containing protein n=1 Tax=Microbulbifer sp. ZKSA006 TaxID=3243390 RepID=UPI004039BBBF
MINKVTLFFVLLVGFVPLGYSESKVALVGQLDGHVREYVDRENFQGVILIAKDDEVFFKAAYGYADLSNENRNTTDKKFLIGSLAKSITAVAVMKLVEQKKLNLHAPIIEYIPNLKRELADGLTLHLLMKHQSGLPQHLERLVSFEYKDVTSDEILAIINKSRRSFTPGSQYQYSNLNYHLAAIAIENVTGKSYAQATKDLIFAPLNMNDTGVERLSNTPGNRANGYRKNLFGIGWDENIVSYALGSGDVYSTVEDLYIWQQSLYDTGFLSKASRDKLFSGEGESFGNYGYGFRIREYQRSKSEDDYGTLIRHGGSMDGFLSNFHRYTEDNITIIVLANIRPFPIRDLTFELKEIVLGAKGLERSRALRE